MISNLSIQAVLADKGDNAPAISAPSRQTLTYGHLKRHVQNTVKALNSFGIGCNDRVAIVLPNGPEMASAFISIAAGATAAPLNPAYKYDEFKFYLSDLGAKALVVEKSSTSPALDAALELGIPILEIESDATQAAGLFQIGMKKGQVSAPPISEQRECQDEDIALVLHTSGTTSRPKIVPLSMGNILASAHNIEVSLALGREDVGLVIMPLFHIHGLIAAILAPLYAGGSVFCTPGFNALKFFSWLDESRPSWYTAVPTMHQAILSRAQANKDIIERNPLKFIRSSSSALPPQVIEALEGTFSTPVIEAYGMTEAAHQMACNPLPPKAHKPGSVGIAAGPEIAILNASGDIIEAQAAGGVLGEIVIRGNNVMKGYENNPQANNEAFKNGWFRTGDQGVLDEQGYLRITGRLKEIINRGGEKISPREVDEVLMDHPAVQQVVTFALAHEKLGEEVAAAIVLKDGASADEKEIKMFASERLASFKVPQKIVFLDEIPKGATGKLQRIGLAEKLGLA